MIESIERIGKFTSSNAYKLMAEGKTKGSFSTAGLTYIQERRIERRMGRSVETESYSRDMAWGTFLEKRVDSLLPEIDYHLVSNTTKVHPVYNFWSGTKDLIKVGVKVGDIKCYQPKNFCILADALMTKNIEVFRKECPKEYWQLVSNAIIEQVPRAESIAYMPYKSELEAIRELASNYDDYDQWKYRFIAEAEDAQLAYLPDGGYYKNLVRFEFEVPKNDIQRLTDRMIMADRLIAEPSVIVAEYDTETNATIISKLKKI